MRLYKTEHMNEPASDEVLMLRYKDGDLSAFEVIIEKHQQPLFSFYIASAMIIIRLKTLFRMFFYVW